MLETSDIRTDGLEVDRFVLPLDEIVGPVCLIAGNEVRIVDRLHRLVLPHERLKLALQLVIKHLRPLHCHCQVFTVNVPPANHQILRPHQRNDILDAHVDLALFGVCDLHGGALGHRAVHVGLLNSLLCVPFQALSIGNNPAQNGRPIIPPKPHHQQPHPASVLVSPEVVRGALHLDSGSGGAVGDTCASVGV